LNTNRALALAIVPIYSPPMPVFEYSAINSTGKASKGTIDSENARAARQKLRSQGVFPTDIREVPATATGSKNSDVKRYFKSNRVSGGDLTTMTRQLSTLIGAGLPLVSGLQALTDQTESPVLQRILVEIRELVEEGSSLATALGRFPKSFPRLYINMVASGEASGRLDTVLTNLADYLEAQQELRRKVISALAYPALMLIICTLVVTALLAFVVPRIVAIFQRQGAVLPLPTRIMIFLSDSITNYWYLVIAIIVGAVSLARWYYRQERGRAVFDRALLRLPVFRTLYLKITTARVASTLSALLASGVGLLQGMEIVRNIVSNVHICKALDDAKDGVREGRSLARELSRSGEFPTMLSHMIAVGERSGELESMLDKAGKSYQNEVNAALAGLTSLLEPLLMIVVGGIVLVIVISVLLPMADLIQVMQQ